MTTFALHDFFSVEDHPNWKMKHARYFLLLLLIPLILNDSYAWGDESDSALVIKELDQRKMFLMLHAGFAVLSISDELDNGFFFSGCYRIRGSRYYSFQLDVTYWRSKYFPLSLTKGGEYDYLAMLNISPLIVVNMFEEMLGFSVLLGPGWTSINYEHSYDSHLSFTFGIDFNIRLYRTHFLSVLAKYQPSGEFNPAGSNSPSLPPVFIGLGVAL